MEQHKIKYQQINWTTLSNIKAKASVSTAELTGEDTVQTTNAILQSSTQIGPDRPYPKKKWFATQHLTQVKGCVRIQF